MNFLKIHCDTLVGRIYTLIRNGSSQFTDAFMTLIGEPFSD